MSESPSKLQERLLYLASPIGLLAVWEILLELGYSWDDIGALREAEVL